VLDGLEQPLLVVGVLDLLGLMHFCLVQDLDGVEAVVVLASNWMEKGSESELHGSTGSTHRDAHVRMSPCRACGE
jgi:hypothetical protein